jgi:hypothetical protein
MLDFKTLAFIMIASLISAVALPGIYSAVFGYAGSDIESAACCRTYGGNICNIYRCGIHT